MRWPRRLVSLLASLLVVVVPPVFMVRLVGWPAPGWPGREQLERWVADPVTGQTVAAALTVLAWLIWLLVVVAVVVRLFVRVRAVAGWMRRIPLPTPLQATATGIAGAAVFGPQVGITATPAPDQPVATTSASGDQHPGEAPAQNLRMPDQAAGAGVSVPGGWVPQDTARQIAAAGALAWLRRRRSYRPDVPDPARRASDLDLAPLPAVVTTVQASVAASTTPERPGHSGGQGDPPVLVFPAGGVGLTGAGASDAARGIVVTAALRALHGPGRGVRVVTTRSDVEDLFGPRTPALAAVAGVLVVSTLDEAVVALRSPLLRSSPPVGQGADTLAGEQKRILLTRPPAAPQARDWLAAVLTRADVALVVLGEWPHGVTWSVDASGHILDPDVTDRRFRRLCVLDTVAATDLLTVISPSGGALAAAEDAAARPAPLSPVSRPRASRRDEDSAEITAAPKPAEAAGLCLRVLGGISMRWQDTPVTVRRTAALQALVFLAVHPHGATVRQLVAAIWPGLPAHRVTGRLYTTMSDLRKAVRDTCGLVPVEHADDRYRLDPDLDVDLWRLHHAVRQASTAVTDRTRAWRAVIDQYGGPLADGYGWPWLDPHRETIRRHVIDAHVALADAQSAPREALVLLQSAIRVDPYNEAVHQRAAHTLTALGEHAAASELLDAYAHRLTQAGLTSHDLLLGSAAPIR